MHTVITIPLLFITKPVGLIMLSEIAVVTVQYGHLNYHKI